MQQVFRSLIGAAAVVALLGAADLHQSALAQIRPRWEHVLTQQPVVASFRLANAITGRAVPGYERVRRELKVKLCRFNVPLQVQARTIPRRRGSVVFRWDASPREHVRNRYPFRLNDPRWRANLPAGRHAIEAVPFSRKNARGRRGRRERLLLTVDAHSGCPVSPNPTPQPSGSPTPVVTPLPPLGESGVSAVWANDGGDKVTRDELRAGRRGPAAVLSRLWDGGRIKLFGARNEVVSFNLVLEAAARRASGVSVVFDRLAGPGGFAIDSRSAAGGGLFDYRGRNIELFVVRYLQIKGLSRLGYGYYDERHIPSRLRRPYDGHLGRGGWEDRPGHDRFFPDIAVPQEAVGAFTISQGENQSIWADIYIPAEAQAGSYSGSLEVHESGRAVYRVPVSLTVKGFSLPDRPAAKSMIYVGYRDIMNRYLGGWPSGGGEEELFKTVRDRHFQMAHRHKLALIDSDEGLEWWNEDRPRPEWEPRLSGALFTADRGYDGPGVGQGSGVYSIGTYGSWSWGEGRAMQAHADAWARWFAVNAPDTEHFLYLIDESYDFARINGWAETLAQSSGPGRNLLSMATIAAPAAWRNAPALDVACSIGGLGPSSDWEGAARYFAGRADKRLFFYNGIRPMSGSFMIEDDGTALRQIPWAQIKSGIQRWFYWESTYFNNFQGGTGETNVFAQARTFGSYEGREPSIGETGWNYSNGDGVLFYPGTDRVYPGESYGLPGPLASLRLKHWRRGVQDADYLALAAKSNPARTEAIIQRMVPKVLWEYGVSDPADPTWVIADISWSSNPDEWEAAREELAGIIEGR